MTATAPSRSHGSLLVIALTLALGWGLFVRTRVFFEPFIHGHLGAGSTHIANFVRNSLRYGLVATRFSKVDNIGPSEPSQFRYAVNHPPLTPLLYLPLAWAGGQKEWSFRLTALLFVLIGWAAFFGIARRLRGIDFATLSMALAAGVAMAGFYDVQVDVQGPDVTAFSMLALASYVRWLEEGRRRQLVGFGIWLALATLSGWAAYYLALAVAFDLVVFRSRPHWLKVTAGLSAGVLLMIALYVGYVGLLKHQDAAEGVGFFEQAWRLRSPFMLPKLLQDPVNRKTFDFHVSQTLGRVRELYTLPGLALAAVGLVAMLARIARRGWSPTERAFLMLFWFGGLHIALFWVGAIIHDYWWKYLVLAFVWAAAEGALVLARFIAGSRAALRLPIAWLLALCVIIPSWPAIEDFYRRDASDTPIVMAREARDRTAFDEVVLSPQFPQIVILRYYVDRYLHHPVDTPAALADAFARFGSRTAVWVGPESLVSKLPLKAFADYLKQRYQYAEVDGHLIVDLRKPKT